MNLYEFSFLTDEEREEIIRSRAAFLASRVDEEWLFDLYALDGFYVEFFYLTHDHGVIKSRCFTSPDELKPYLGLIDIDIN
ncbi:MAG: hypothetical protein ABI151_04250 [Chitinophagaceae bacterium]